MHTQLEFASASELINLVATKQVSPVDLTELFFQRIDTLDVDLHSFLLIAYDQAIEAAKSAEKKVMRGDSLGPLHGLPISIKDTQMTRGMVTTQGSIIYKNRVPDRDSAVVEKVLEAGAIILGKTNVPEFGMVGTCENSLGPPGGNPWNTSHTPGGSSGGAAASVASYLCPMATGSDGGGSIRIPANFCGIYGIKPTQGRVSAYTGLNGIPMPSIFSQNGPLTRTVLDSALLLQTLSGFDARDPTSLRESPPDFISAVNKDISDLKIAWSPDFGFAEVVPDVLNVTTKAVKQFEKMGCNVEQPTLILDEPYNMFGPIQAADSYATLGNLLGKQSDQITDFVRFFLEIGSKVTTAEYSKALSDVEHLKSVFTDLFEEYDLLLTPTACFPAFANETFPGPMTGKSKYPDLYWNGAFTLPINVIGHTAATIPAGLSSSGLPIGLQIVGKRGGEGMVLAASAAFERERPWIQNKPPLS